MTRISSDPAVPGVILAGACVPAAPAVVLFPLFQRFAFTNLGSGVRG
ncbi:hypothetical protein NGB36_09875 [Streptomyces sp. RB6PN25]|uniref:Uncharacterized protein n=1 Tax=Streptomyces humicola TaxID=2953240 RepID=A0ABT1PWI6_9ACTN|nr:hypothetical protein [Streptomyces humicola]MCQ4080900.1 hypothetical protein [Streptomyces humicola]